MGKLIGMMAYPLKPLKRIPSSQPHIIIKSAPYSASKGICKYLQSCGIGIGHEEVMEHGISSWYHAHYTRQNFIDAGFDKDVIILHQIRHPLMVISGLMGMNKLKWQRQNLILGPRGFPLMTAQGRIENVMIFWYYWNKMASVD